MAGYEMPAIFVLHDFHEFLRDSAEVRRRLREAYEPCLAKDKFVVVCSPVKDIPSEVEREIALIKLPMPDSVELEGVLRGESKALTASGASCDLSDESVYLLTQSLQGLTFNEARVQTYGFAQK